MHIVLKLSKNNLYGYFQTTSKQKIAASCNMHEQPQKIFLGAKPPLS